jgi:hypothetical protein
MRARKPKPPAIVTAECGCRWVNGMHVHACGEHRRLLGG